MQHAVISKTEVTPITATPEPTWATVAATARGLWNAFGRADTGQYPWHPIMKDLAKQAGGLARTKLVSADKAVQAAATAENLARVLAEDPSGYRNYAINPDGLAELVCGVTSIQVATRHLASAACPGAGGIGIERAFYPAGWVVAPLDEMRANQLRDARGRESRLRELGSEFEKLAQRLDDLNSVAPVDGDAFEDTVAAMQPIIDAAMPIPATSLEELRVKAIIADHWQPAPGTDDYDDLHWIVVRSLIGDTLDLTGGRPAYCIQPEADQQHEPALLAAE